MRHTRFVTRRLAGCALTLALLLSAAGHAQEPLAVRLLRAEDARMLTADVQALFVEGMKSAEAAVRAQAVRAAGRFETPAVVGDVLPLLADPDANVRRWAAVAAASSARIFPTQSIDALIKVMPSAAPADWAELAANLGRIAVSTRDQFHQIEQAILAGLPSPTMSAQVVRTPREAPAVEVVKVEGAARGLEALTRASGKVDTLSADGRSRLFLVVERTDGAQAAALVRARRLALQALRNARAIDSGLVRLAVKDPDDEVRRLAVVAAGAPVTADAPSLVSAADREAVLTAGLADAEPRVRYEAVRGWSRHLQAAQCDPVAAAAKDGSTHVALAAIDALAAECALPAVSRVLQGLAEALPAQGPDWHRAAHAVVSLARRAPNDARTLVPRFAGHPTWQVRKYAAAAAGAMAAIETLTRLGGDSDDNVREAALDELVRLKRPEALAVAYEGLTRPDYQLVMTSARALAADTDTPRAMKALTTALLRLTLHGRDTARDPRVAIVTSMTTLGSAADADGLAPFLSDADPRVAELAAKAIQAWTGQARPATARPRPPQGPELAVLDKARGQRLRITMARGGVLDLRLLPDVAPATVARVAALAAKGYYDGLTFHRVEPTFVLQGGSPGANEFMGDAAYMRDEPGLAHNRGTVGISTRGRDTGDAQLFVNLVDSPRLDHAYTVFAVVERGMDVADRVLEGDVMTKVELVDAPRR